MKSAWASAATAAFISISIGALVFAPGGARASTTVIGGGIAHDCGQLAIAGQFGREALETCTLALEEEPLDRADEAKTHVNRAVIYLRRGAFDRAGEDLASAQRLDPSLAEIYVNRGALLIRETKYQEAIDEINHGLSLNPSEPEKAYFNRALAREQMDDPRGAYLDYRKANELNPKWPEPVKAMSRFEVRHVGS
jgi:tetratricopeptide (TPR) repeat protein